MSMRPFMSYPEGPYAAHWLAIIGACTNQPIFAHVNWFQRDAEDGHFLWPGYRENLRALLWLMQLRDGEVIGVESPVGILPAKDELDTNGLDIDPADLDKLLTIDVDRWREEIGFRQAHLEQFADLPEESGWPTAAWPRLSANSRPGRRGPVRVVGQARGQGEE